MHNCTGGQQVGSAKGLGLVDPRLFEEDGDREGKGLTCDGHGPWIRERGLIERIVWRGRGEYRCKSEGRILWVIKEAEKAFLLKRWATRGYEGSVSV